MAARYEDLGTRIAENGMETPDFLGYDAYFYMGMYFDNVAGFSDSKYSSPLENIWIQGRPGGHPFFLFFFVFVLKVQNRTSLKCIQKQVHSI